MHISSAGSRRPPSASLGQLSILPLGAAILFGASTPVAKVLVGSVEPVLLAAFLYLGSGLGLLAWAWARSVAGRKNRPGRIRSRDIPFLAGAALAGGVAAPVLLLLGLRSTPASVASLLLSLEGLLTAMLARLVLREHLGRRLWVSMGALTVGCGILAWDPAEPLTLSWGGVAIGAACAGWAMDNNLTARISEGDPARIAGVKGLAAGGANLALALSTGAQIPSATIVLCAGAAGLVCFGLSLVLFIRSLRRLGAARTGAYFAAAPYAGAILSIALLGEAVTFRLALGAVLTGAGVLYLLGEHHGHLHAHDASKSGPGPAAPWEHDHPHFPDADHRHEH